ncbi:Cytochrome b561 and DOMON domain-containing protein [Raphanus sativus]|nr:Cytochrome b561 and DOMON domain-containing protein [Raphanus sativus]
MRTLFRFYILCLLLGQDLPFLLADDVTQNLCFTNRLSDFLPPPYSNISDSMTCTPLWNTFVLRYSENRENVMTIIVSALYTTGWVGIGFSRDGKMVGSSAMVGWITKKGHAKIKQYYLQGTERDRVVPDQGELQLEKLGRLSKHDDKTTAIVDFSKANGVTSVETTTSTEKTKHGVMAIIGWGFLLPLGAILARYLRHRDPLWYYLHICIQLTGFIFGLAAVILGVRLYSRIQPDIPAHRGIGIFLLSLSILQVLAFFARPHKETKMRRYWNWYHHWIGRISLFFGAVNIVLGIRMANNGEYGWKIGYGFVLAVTLLAFLVLEIFRIRGYIGTPSFVTHPSSTSV